MPETLSLALKLNRPQDLYHGRTRHPNEVPFVTDSQAGRINLQFYPDETPKNGWIGSLKRLIRRSYVSCFRDNAKEGMKLADLFSHCITFGGPGSGKTFSFIQPLWEEWFKSTHVSDEGEHDCQLYANFKPIKATRQKLKFCAFVIDQTTDFRNKTWQLAQKYGRMDDCVFFGVAHGVTYDAFGDPTETFEQKAQKIRALVNVYQDREHENDPFFCNVMQRIFMYVFILHDAVYRAFQSATTDEDKKTFNVDPMSWQLLDLLLMESWHQNQCEGDSPTTINPQPYAALRQLIYQYEETLKRANKDPRLDPVRDFFIDAFLNPENNKIAMEAIKPAKGVIDAFTQTPLRDIFTSRGTLTFNNAIDEGKIVYLDIPVVLYAKAALCALTCMKIDFFRTVLSRPQLHRRNIDGSLDSELVDQNRPIVYLCEELPSIVSSGPAIGESEFMDKASSLNCSCLFSAQSIPQLQKKVGCQSASLILSSAGIKAFFKTSDPTTIDYVSKLTTKRNSFGPEDFSKLKPCEAIVSIPQQFKDEGIQRGFFQGRPIENIDTENLYPPPAPDPNW